ncbi:hypothetical protein [Prosthecobacter sp.]|uniref:hypothetical protein n=1 Tax=Prosthecobacter sp. TaxID=1965333 RepID=UPI001DA93D11|nr:hypothetical protein [Prosthecobacter sp.]MCB1275365.1 hypothetical protein [Prosthecobacter sp.]
MGHKVQFAGVLLKLEGDWRDITDTLPAGTPPTLALEDGIGALQFTVGHYQSGETPGIGLKALERLLYHFEDAQNLERETEASAFRTGLCFGISCEYNPPTGFIRVWYVTDGKNIAFVTYTSEDDRSQAFAIELKQASSIATSVEFD